MSSKKVETDLYMLGEFGIELDRKLNGGVVQPKNDRPYIFTFFMTPDGSMTTCSCCRSMRLGDTRQTPAVTLGMGMALLHQGKDLPGPEGINKALERAIPWVGKGAESKDLRAQVWARFLEVRAAFYQAQARLLKTPRLKAMQWLPDGGPSIFGGSN